MKDFKKDSLLENYNRIMAAQKHRLDENHMTMRNEDAGSVSVGDIDITMSEYGDLTISQSDLHDHVEHSIIIDGGSIEKFIDAIRNFTHHRSTPPRGLKMDDPDDWKDSKSSHKGLKMDDPDDWKD